LVSTGERPRIAGQGAPAIRWLVLVVAGAVTPGSAHAQSLAAFGVRGGVGVDSSGKLVYDAQIGLTDLSGSTNVEVAIRGLGEAFSTRSYQTQRASLTFDNDEELSVWGIGLTADFLFGHASGTYWMLGLGVGPLWYAWRLESTDPRVGEPLPEGGGFLEEEGVSVGSFLSAGVGQRLHRRVDLRAGATLVLLPSTDLREELETIPAFTLTAGIRP
jgi:hypothetical protein